MAKNNKNLLNEAQITKFMKLANLEPLTPGFVHGLREGESVDEGRVGDFFRKTGGALKKGFGAPQDRAGWDMELPWVRHSESESEHVEPEKGSKEEAALRKRVRGANEAEARGRRMADEEAMATFRVKQFDGTATPEDRAASFAAQERLGIKTKSKPGSGEAHRAAIEPGQRPQPPQEHWEKEAEAGQSLPRDDRAHWEKEAEAGQSLPVSERRLRRESHGRGRGETASGWDEKDPRLREQDELELEDDLEMDVPLEGDVDLDVEDIEDVEVLDEPDDLEGADVQVSIDDFLSALEQALEAVLGEEVEVAQEEEEEELEDLEGLEDEAELDADLDMEAAGLEDEELALQERRLNHLMRALQEKKRQKYGGNKGDIPDEDRKKKTKSGKRGPASKEDVKERGVKLNKESLNVDALVNRITARVAKRIVGESLKRK